jgi:HTH-type transcriptional regulator / antitoxin HigA
MEIKPIRTSTDYENALKLASQLADADPGTAEGDRLEVLATLIEAYESSHFHIPEPDDPASVLEYILQTRSLSRKDLIPYLGSKERVSEVLNGKRSLSLSMIRRLHAGLGIPADLLIGRPAGVEPPSTGEDEA